MEWSGCEAIRVWAVSETGPGLCGWGLQKADRAGGEVREHAGARPHEVDGRIKSLVFTSRAVKATEGF